MHHHGGPKRDEPAVSRLAGLAGDLGEELRARRRLPPSPLLPAVFEGGDDLVEVCRRPAGSSRRRGQRTKTGGAGSADAIPARQQATDAPGSLPPATGSPPTRTHDSAASSPAHNQVVQNKPAYIGIGAGADGRSTSCGSGWPAQPGRPGHPHRLRGRPGGLRRCRHRRVPGFGRAAVRGPLIRNPPPRGRQAQRPARPPRRGPAQGSPTRRRLPWQGYDKPGEHGNSKSFAHLGVQAHARSTLGAAPGRRGLRGRYRLLGGPGIPRALGATYGQVIGRRSRSGPRR